MKFSLFAHMERTDDQIDHETLYHNFVELCQMADAADMRAVWTGEHHGMDFTIAPNPLLCLTDIAQKTSRVRLGTGTLVAPFWHPIKMAGETAMTDLITGGRLEIGIARGAYSYEYERLMPGMDAWEAGGRLRECIPAVKKLWAGNYAHDGEFYQFPSTSSAPRPLQQPGPPIWVAARDPNSHEFAVANGCNVQVTPLWNGMDEIESLMQRFNDACHASPAVPRPKIMLLQHAFVGADEQAVQSAAKMLSKFYCYFGAWFQNKRPVTSGQIQRLSAEELAGAELYSPEVMLKNLAIGTAQQVIDRLKRYEDLGYDEFSFWVDNGMGPDAKKESLSRFIDEVMPAFS